MELNIGDKIKIKDNLKNIKYVTKEMLKYKGKIGTIIECAISTFGEIYFKLDIDNGFWCWYPNMLELIENNRTNFNVIHDANINQLATIFSELMICDLCAYQGSLKCTNITIDNSCRKGVLEFLMDKYYL